MRPRLRSRIRPALWASGCTAYARRSWPAIRPGHGELAVLGVALVVLSLLTADVLAGGLLSSLDGSVRDATAPVGDPPAWTRAVGVLGNVGVAGAATVVVSIVTMQVTWRWWPGVLTIGQLAATGLVVVALKYLVGRPGPSADLTDGYPGYYPSGHTATAAVCLGTIVFLLSSRRGRPLARARRRGLAAGAAAGLLVGASSVLGGFHWFSDVLASLVVAAAVLTVGLGRTARHVEGARRPTASRAR